MAVTDRLSAVHRRLASGVAYNFIAAAAAQGSTLVANVLLSRHFGRAWFGQYSVVQVTLATIASVSLLSMSSVTNKFVAEYRTKDPTLASRAYSFCSRISNVMGLAGLLITALLSQEIAAVFLKDRTLAVPLLLGSVFVFAQNRSLFLSAVLAGLEEYKRYAVAAVVAGIAYLIAVYGGAQIGQLNGAALGLSVAAVAFWICLWVMSRRAFHEHKLFSLTRFDDFEKEMLTHFAVPAIASGYLLLPGNWWLSGFLYQQAGPQEMGLYSVATQIRLLLIFLPIVISNVGISVLNNTKGSRDYQSTHRVTTGSIFVFTLIGAGIVALLGPIILSVFGSGYANGYPVLLVLAISTIAEGVASGLRARLNAQRLMWRWLFAVIVPWQGSAFIMSLILIPRLGALGAAYSYLAGAVVYVLASWILCFGARELEALNPSESPIANRQSPMEEAALQKMP